MNMKKSESFLNLNDELSIDGNINPSYTIHSLVENQPIPNIPIIVTRSMASHQEKGEEMHVKFRATQGIKTNSTNTAVNFWNFHSGR